MSLHALSLLLLAVGLAFWQISTDRQAGVVFDTKGLLLNLGQSSAFVSWANIERIGTTDYRQSVLTIGSGRQVGIALRDIVPYIQSYEERLPSSNGVFSLALRFTQEIVRRFLPQADTTLITLLQRNRSNTGFDVLVPETLLGGQADAFLDLVDVYRRWPQPI